MDIDKAWAKLERYFDIKMGNEKIYPERKNFKYGYIDKKIFYYGENIELAKQLVNNKLLVIEKR